MDMINQVALVAVIKSKEVNVHFLAAIAASGSDGCDFVRSLAVTSPRSWIRQAHIRL